MGQESSVTSMSQEHQAVENCRNCGAAVDYHFCAVCGQETSLHVASASEFIHEFVAHYVALEGRLWKTLELLLFKPGFLTLEYIQGRRSRYVQPLRVYLTFSVLFFIVLKLSGTPIYDGDVSAPAPAAARAPATSGAATLPRPQAASDAGGGQEIDISVARHVPGLQQRFDSFMLRPAAEKKAVLTAAFFGYVPYALFCLMPLFALYLKLLYAGSGRRYGEHLLFALHANAFAFAIISVQILVHPLGLGLLNFALGAWLLLYLPTAMRRVYGGSRLITALRWIVLAGLHLLSIATAIISTFGWAILR